MDWPDLFIAVGPGGPSNQFPKQHGRALGPYWVSEETVSNIW